MITLADTMYVRISNMEILNKTIIKTGTDIPVIIL